MLNNKSDKVLNLQIVKRILEMNSVRKKYTNINPIYYKVNSNFTFQQLYIKVDSNYLRKIDNIINDIEELFTNDVLINNKIVNVYREAPKKSATYAALVLKQSSNTVKFIFLKDEKRIDSLPRWKINELIFPSMINESIDNLKDELYDIIHALPQNYSPRLTLKIYSKNNKEPIYIKYINSAKQVGDVRVNNLQIKQDVEFQTVLGKTNISIKMNNHPAWSSASAYPGAVSILKQLIKDNEVQFKTNTSNYGEFVYNNKTYSGLAFPATKGEVKKFCFDENNVDYIIINDFNINDIDTSYERYGNNINDWSVNMRVDLLYPNTQEGISQLQPNVFLEIYSSSKNSSVMTAAGYSGVSIHFIPENKIKETTARIIDLPYVISGRI